MESYCPPRLVGVSPCAEGGESHDGQDAARSCKLYRGADATLGARQILLQKQGVKSLQADGETHREHFANLLTLSVPYFLYLPPHSTSFPSPYTSSYALVHFPYIFTLYMISIIPYKCHKGTIYHQKLDLIVGLLLL